MGIQCPKCHTDNPDTARFCSHCATPLPSQGVSVTKTLETPTRKLALGSIYAERYEILENLGKGGMGEVYKVKDEKLDEEMALKVLKPEIAANKDMIARFKNELKLARKIAHRHVCRMYDLNEEEGTLYITMEYVKGEDLKSSILKKGKLSEKLAVAVARQVCQGLALDPSWGDAYEELAFAYANTGDDEKALDYLQKGSAANPGDPRMNLTAGQFYVKMGKIDDAIRKFKSALDIKPDFTIQNFLAYAYAMKEDYDEAINWSSKFSEGALSGGIEAKGYWFRSFYHSWIGQLNQAIEDLQTAWDIVHQSGDRDFMSEFVMARFYYLIGKSDLSRQKYQGWNDGLLEQNPKAGQEQRSYWAFWTHHGLGINDVKEGDIDSARSHLKEMEAVLPKMTTPSGWGAAWLHGLILFAERSYDEAISVLSETNSRKMPWIWNTSSIFGYNWFNETKALLVLAYKEKGDLDQATAVLE